MKIKTIFCFLFSVSIFSCTAQPAIVDTGRLKPLPEHEKVSKAVTGAIETYHYKKPILDDSLSKVIFDHYLKDLDNNRAYFLKSDILEFSKYRDQIGKYLENGDMSVPFAMYNRFFLRQKERFKFVFTLLKDSIKTNTRQVYQIVREKQEWMETSKDLDDYWKKKVEFDIISLDMAQKDHKKGLETLLKRYQNLDKQINKTKSEDVFLVFMNAFVSSVDPHTTYFSPNKKKDFNIEMSKSLEGIGAVLQQDNDYIKIASLSKGGPAEKSKQLSPSDRIVAVAQGKTGEFVDIIGWRTDEAVQLIRGTKGTLVRLKILSGKSATTSLPQVVELVRDKINLTEQRASSSINETIRNGIKYKIGVINLSDFYLDFEAAQRGDKNYNSTSRDVRRILDSLQKGGIDGIVLDLRNNGGGSLKEAIDLTGLFIKLGPVVQVKDMNGKIEVDADKNPEQTYSGPLAVLVNTFSASASEIFAGAIQDYGRGVIIGESTYGKGTVQSAFSINDILPGIDKPLGQLNLTIAKFYRINGSSTQLKGVTPDILFPNKIPRNKFGEESESSALPWDQIESSRFQLAGTLPTIKVQLQRSHDLRMANNIYYKEWVEDIEDLNVALNKDSVVLDRKTLEKEHLEEDKRDLVKYNILRKLSDLPPILSDSKLNNRTPIDPELLIKKESFQVIADIVDITKKERIASKEVK